MGPSAQTRSPEPDIAAFHTWEVEGKPVAVELEFDLIDRVLREALRGLGFAPKRGIEVGGILLGSVRRERSRTVVRVEDFEPVACEHSQGMVWQLTGEDVDRFEEVLGRWRREGGRRTYAVGFYRSHTREGLGLAAPDLEMFNRYFPEACDIALLVKPLATRASAGAIFFRENDAIRSETSYQEFPFERPEPKSETGPPSASMTPKGAVPPMFSTPFSSRPLTAEGPMFGIPASSSGDSYSKKVKRGWVWIPLSFIFLLVGVIVGVQASLSLSAHVPALFRPDPYTMSLTATAAGDGVHLRWNRNSAAIQASLRGQLTITDGANQKVVNLDAGQLQNGSVIYRRTSDEVKFSLAVSAHERVTVTETVEFKAAETR